MVNELPHGTTQPRGLPSPDRIYWPMVPSRELFELQYGKALVASNRRPGAVPVYGRNGQCGFHDESLFRGPGVILGRKGQGPLGVEWSDFDYWVIDTAYYLNPIRPDVDLKYAYHMVKHIGLNHLKDGTSNPTLSRDSFGTQALPLPPLNHQRAIAHILGTLDDKIELNRRMNETLENMARALFNDWFVAFGPTRAKLAGQEPYLPKHLWDLFPDAMDDTDELPAGWQSSDLSSYADLNPASWTKNTYPDHIIYADLSGVKWGRIESSTHFERESAPSRAQRILRNGDTIVGTVRPGNGSYALVQSDGITGSTGFAVLRPKEPGNREFVYLAATNSENITSLVTLADGGAYPAVRPDVVLATNVPSPPNPLMTAFSRVCRPLLARYGHNESEAQTLAALRDTLLPRLISGELRVPDVERILERAL